MRFNPIFTAVLLSLATPVMADDLAVPTGEARAVAQSFVSRLGGRLKEELGNKGAAPAIDVCRDFAPAMASELSRKHGWKVSRVSLKARNPVLGTPDAWEQTRLAELDARAAKGEKPETLEVAEIVSEPQGKFFRYLKAMPVQEVCQNCHGTPDKVPDAVKARLKDEYPHDRATGYTPGQIRGAITIKRPL